MAYSYLNKINIVDYTQQDWLLFKDIFIQKTLQYLQFQSKLFLKNYKGNCEKWEQQEQNLLKQIIQDEQYKGKWNQISKALYFNSNKKYYRQPQKCREHWFNHLDPDVKRQHWSFQEDLKLVETLKQSGFKWSIVTKQFKGTRTEHMVKNRAKYLFKKYGGDEDSQDESSKRILKKIQKQIKFAIQMKNHPLNKEQNQSYVNQQKKQFSQNNNKKQKQETKNKKKQIAENKLQEKNFKKKYQVKIQQQIQSQKNEEQSSEKNEIYNQKLPRNISNSPFFQRNLFGNMNKQQIQKNSFIKNQVYFITAPIHQSIPFAPIFGFSPYQHQLQNNNSILMPKRPSATQVYLKPQQTLQKTQKLSNVQNDAVNEPQQFKDEHGIIEQFESEEQHMNLNLQQIKFNHERDGGKMRERITHQLEALFNSMNQQEQKQDFSEF